MTPDSVAVDLEQQPDVTWVKNETDGTYTYIGTFKLTKEDEYKVSVEYKDLACNKMEGINGVSCTEGVYTSNTLVLDRTAPKFSISYTTAPVNTNGDVSYYNRDEIKGTITITEQHALYDKTNKKLNDVTVKSKDGAEITSDVEWDEKKNETD